MALTKFEELQEAMVEMDEAGKRYREAKDAAQLAHGLETRAINELNRARKGYDEAVAAYIKDIDPQWGHKNLPVPIAG